MIYISYNNYNILKYNNNRFKIKDNIYNKWNQSLRRIIKRDKNNSVIIFIDYDHLWNDDDNDIF